MVQITSGAVTAELVPSPYRRLILPILQYLDQLEKERYGDQIIVVIPEFETGNWFTHFLHNATSWRLRQVLLGLSAALRSSRRAISV